MISFAILLFLPLGTLVVSIIFYFLYIGLRDRDWLVVFLMVAVILFFVGTVLLGLRQR